VREEAELLERGNEIYYYEALASLLFDSLAVNNRLALAA
jgi:hypothetical protein